MWFGALLMHLFAIRAAGLTALPSLPLRARGAGLLLSRRACVPRASASSGAPAGDAHGGGTLYVVPVPLGNLEDITVRALKCLQRADVIVCEDTRRTGSLLSLLGVERREGRRLISCHEHNEKLRVPEVLSLLREDLAVALVSDAGTPAISDPGHHVVRAVADAGLPMVSLPGPCAAVTALAAAGFEPGPAVIQGFLPGRRGKQRAQEVAAVAGDPRVVVLYEAPHRIRFTLEDLAAAGSAERSVVIGRELTKLHETYFRGTVGDALAAIDDGGLLAKGEFTVVLGPQEAAGAGAAAAAAAAAEGLTTEEYIARAIAADGGDSSLNNLAKRVAADLGLKKRDVYKAAVELVEDPARLEELLRAESADADP